METIRNTRGLSLIEMLCAVLLVGLLGMGMVTGVGLAQKQFVKSLQRSEAPQLFSTIETLLTNELKYTTDIDVDENGNVLTVYSNTYALHRAKTAIVSIDKEYQETSDYGYIAFGNGGQYNPILGEASYPNGLGAKVTTLTYSKENSLFTVTLDIGAKGQSIFSETFNVRALNNVGVNQ